MFVREVQGINIIADDGPPMYTDRTSAGPADEGNSLQSILAYRREAAHQGCLSAGRTLNTLEREHRKRVENADAMKANNRILIASTPCYRQTGTDKDMDTNTGTNIDTDTHTHTHTHTHAHAATDTHTHTHTHTQDTSI